jgi:hypothetical protein
MQLPGETIAAHVTERARGKSQTSGPRRDSVALDEESTREYEHSRPGGVRQELRTEPASDPAVREHRVQGCGGHGRRWLAHTSDDSHARYECRNEGKCEAIAPAVVPECTHERHPDDPRGGLADQRQ